MATLDETDRKILALLQEDARLTQAELAKRLAMSQTSCWRRVRQLEEAGVIARRVALVDPRAVDLTVSVIASVSLTSTATRTGHPSSRSWPHVPKSWSATP